jgi:SAM-dependent methyltransferase
VRPVDPAILEHYDAVREEDRIAGGLGRLELLRTREVLRRHLPQPPARIIDIGGATGVHASWLADDGYEVRIVDIADRHVRKANADLAHKGVFALLADARRLPYPAASFDCALLLGPLYHLTEETDRLAALREARRVVRPAGLIGIGAVNRCASLFDGLGRQFLFDPEFATMARQDLASGQHRNPGRRPEWWTTAFLHRPDQLRREAERARLVVTELVGLEGLAGYLPALAGRVDDPADRETILWSARAIESEPALLGLSAHLLLVAAAPPRPGIEPAVRAGPAPSPG